MNVLHLFSTSFHPSLYYACCPHYSPCLTVPPIGHLHSSSLTSPSGRKTALNQAPFSFTLLFFLLVHSGLLLYLHPHDFQLG
jgi:hypothetical protein